MIGAGQDTTVRCSYSTPHRTRAHRRFSCQYRRPLSLALRCSQPSITMAPIGHFPSGTRDPDECFVFVPSETGPEVFQHLVLPFGGTSSVWAYLRVADIICLITLALAYIPASHFVDDFYFGEPAYTAESAFECFCMLQSLFGFTMKESKAQKPCSKSILLGVLWEILEQTIQAGPSQGRLEKLHTLIEKHRQTTA